MYVNNLGVESGIYMSRTCISYTSDNLTDVVAVSDTYWDEISDGYFIRDRIYYGWHRIPGWHTYPGMAHLPGNFNSGTLT